MRRLLSISLITLALVVGVAGVAPAAHAVGKGEKCGAVSSTKTDKCDTGLVCYGDNKSTDNDTTITYTQGTCMTEEDADAAIDAAAKKQTEEDSYTMLSKAFDWVMMKIMSLFAWLLGVAALTLNYAVFYTVVTAGKYVNELSAVGITWTIMRDIGNIMLIFGFLAVGISVILNSEWYGGGKKMLPMLLAAAVFINFSLFFTEAVIDVGNLFATQIYTQINGGKLPDPSTEIKNEGISNKIMSKLNLQDLYGAATESKKVFKDGSPWYLGFMGILLFIVTAFVMFALAFILIFRFIALIFLIVIAPIGFAGFAIPQLASIAKKWWDTLVDQTITAPVLMLLLYIALKVITDENFLSVSGNSKGLGWTNFLNGTPTGIGVFASMLLSFLVAMGLLLAVVIIAKKLSAFGAAGATKLAGKLSFGATAWAGRRTVGRVATAASVRFKSSKYARSGMGRVFAGGLEKVAGGSFDVRGVKAFGGLKGMGVEAGDAQEGGYAKIRKDATEVRTKYAKTLELTPEEEERVKQLENDQKMLDKNIKETNDEISEINSEIKQAQKDGKDTTQLKARKRSMESLKEVQEKRKEVLDTKTALAKNAAQVEYAEKIEKWSTIGGPESMTGKVLSVPYSLMVGSAANKDASKKILKEAKKSKSDKDLETLKKILEDSEKKSPGGAEKKEKKEIEPEKAPGT